MKRYAIDVIVVLATAATIWLVRDYMAYRAQLDNVVQWIVNQQKAAQQAQKPQTFVEKHPEPTK